MACQKICHSTDVELRFTTRCGIVVSNLDEADGPGETVRKPEHTTRKTAVRRKRTLPLHVFQLKRGGVRRGKDGSFHHHRNDFQRELYVTWVPFTVEKIQSWITLKPLLTACHCSKVENGAFFLHSDYGHRKARLRRLRVHKHLQSSRLERNAPTG